MILTEKAIVKWHRKTKEHYESIEDINGNRKYVFNKFGGVFEVDIDDIFIGSVSNIEIKCDYCGNEEKKIYRNWRLHFDKSPIKKDACIKCRGKKTKESNMLLYGVENVMHIQETKDKITETNMERYGVPLASMSEIVKDKIKETNLNKYGSEYYFQTEVFKNQYKDAMQSKYGVDNSFQAEEVKLQSKQTMLLNWGVEYNMQNPEIRAKAVNSMYQRGSTPTSKPQLYLHQIYGGELNFPFERYNLDIALTNEKIVIEYDGGGHDLKVKLGGISEEDFKRREIVRGAYLKQGGWKLITIKSKFDNLPSEEDLLNMLDYAKEIFNKGRSWINFCVDSNQVEYKNNRERYSFKHIDKYKTILKKVESL